MNLDTVNGLIDKASQAKARADEIAAEHRKDGKWSGAEAKANYEAAIDEALDAKKAADGAVEELKVSRKAGELAEWLAQPRATLPGMATDQKAADVPTLPRVEYKASDGRVKVAHPTGNRHFKAQQEAAYTDTFRRYLAGGMADMSTDDRQLIEQKALSMGIDATGGALVAPEVVMSELIEVLEDAVLMRRLGRVLPPLTSAASVRVGTASDLDDATWTSELLTGSADTAQPFGARSLTPHPMAKRVKISNTLLRLSGIDVEAWVRGEIANRIAETEENGFMTGSGAQQPLGVFTSSLPTTVTAASATDIAYADLVEVEFSLKSQYRARASWIMHRTIIKELMLLVDGTGRPLLRDMPGAGVRFSLFGYDINESEYAPSSSATGLKVAALGDWKRAYWIVDSLNLTVQRLVELYAETNETGFIARSESDGMVVDGNGVSILVMA